jgi:hypothetical protein
MSIKRFSGAGLTTPKSSRLWDQTTFQSGMFALATVSLTTTASSIVFSDIPADYKHLQISGLSQTNRATFAIDEWKVTFNGVGGTSYSYHNLYGDGANPTASSGTSAAFINLIPASTSSVMANTFGAAVVDILDYSNTNKFKTLRALNGGDINGTIAGYGGNVGLTSGLFQSTNAVFSIEIVPKFGSLFNQHSQFALYGIKAG